jgi:hypothetical protein
MKNECFVAFPDGHAQHGELQVLGLFGHWQFSEKTIDSACGRGRFQFFRTITFDTERPFATERVSYQQTYGNLSRLTMLKSKMECKSW